ncbi:MAG: hypothetical protein ACJ8E3_01415 [Sphingomicrobium sp.]
MSSPKTPKKPTEKDASAVEAKFGDFADVYAEARSEAAEIAGNKPGKHHWEEVAANVDDDDQ